MKKKVKEQINNTKDKERNINMNKYEIIYIYIYIYLKKCAEIRRLKKTDE